MEILSFWAGSTGYERSIGVGSANRKGSVKKLLTGCQQGFHRTRST